MIDVTSAIADQLKLYFSETPVYRENQEAGFKEPSFFVNKVSTTPNSLFYGQQYRTYTYQIIYFPNPNKVNTDMDHMEELLLNGFVTTSYGSLRNRDFLKQDNTLIMNFDIDIIAKPVDNTDKQNTMDYRGGL